MTKNAYVLCTGCPESRIDSARVEIFLQENGWDIINDFKEADLILLRACGLTEKTAKESLEIVRIVEAEKKENSRLIVWGCLPKIDQEALGTEYAGVTFGEKDIGKLNEVLAAKNPIEGVTANYLMPIFEPKVLGPYDLLRKLQTVISQRLCISPSPAVFSIKASTGCLGSCSFCAVRKSRGVLRSKGIDSVLSEFKRGLEAGFQCFALLATDLGAYGRDLGCNLAQLLAEMTKTHGNYRIGLRNVNPYYLNEMFGELMPVFSSGKIWFLSSAVESGSNRILKLMRRTYRARDFKGCVQILNRDFPTIFLRTQIMVGFPTETEEDFQNSLSLLEELRFDWVEVYKFSPRRGTLAATMNGQVPDKVKEDRFRKLALRAMIQRPRRKIGQIIRSYLRPHCEQQDWVPPTRD